MQKQYLNKWGDFVGEYLREDEVVVSIKDVSLVYQGDQSEVIALKDVNLDIIKVIR